MLCKRTRTRAKSLSHLEHEVVRDVRLVRLHGLQNEGVPQVEERAQVHQDRMGQLRNIYRPFTKRNKSRILRKDPKTLPHH